MYECWTYFELAERLAATDAGLAGVPTFTNRDLGFVAGAVDAVEDVATVEEDVAVVLVAVDVDAFGIGAVFGFATDVVVVPFCAESPREKRAVNAKMNANFFMVEMVYALVMTSYVPSFDRRPG
jgi:hypothetical protein